MSKNLLTIAVPTYKRPEFLEKCLASIYSSINGLDVEVLVMDDSLDDTNLYVCKKYPSIRHIRNDVNLGIDKNICACIENASSRYVWLIGEDDLMRIGGFAEVYKLLETNPVYPFVFVNYSYITNDQSKVLRRNSIEVTTGELDFLDFFEKYLWSAGFIGACIIERDGFLATKYKEYQGTYYAHVAGLSLASKDKRILVVGDPVVGNRVGDASTFTWSGDFLGVFQGWRILLKKLQNSFGEKSCAIAYQSHKNAHGYLNFKFFLNKKADGLLTKASLDELIKHDVSQKEIKKAKFVTYFIPGAFCRLLREIYGNLKRTRVDTFSPHAK